MNRKLLDILACPIDKHHPLELFESESNDEKIIEGALYCQKCSRFFSIIDETKVPTSKGLGNLKGLSPILK